MPTLAESLSLKDLITFGVALLGAVLGILNTWKAYDKDRPKLRIIPKHAIPVGGVDPCLTFCIEIINLSGFALTVCEVGVLYRGTKSRLALIQQFFRDGGPWPRRLEPRAAVTVYFDRESLDARTHNIRCAYAMTECDLVFEGNSPAMRQLARETAARDRKAIA
jgi:hypothetical protein